MEVEKNNDIDAYQKLYIIRRQDFYCIKTVQCIVKNAYIIELDLNQNFNS